MNLIVLNMGIDDFNIRHFRNFIFDDIDEYFEEKQIGNEYVYESKIGKINNNEYIIRVYSSIDIKSGKVRNTGKDAIHVNICDRYGNTLYLDNERYKHIKRTSGWKKRLTKRVKDYTKKFPNNIERCPECSNPLKITTGKYGKFISCASWSPNDKNNCDYTDSL